MRRDRLFRRRTKDGMPILTFTSTSTGLDADADFAAVLVVRCKPCGGEIGWVWDTPDHRGPLGPAIMTQGSFPDEDPFRDRSRPVTVSTAGLRDAYTVVSSFSTVRSYCGVCRKFRTIHRRDIEAAILDGKRIIRVP